MKRKSQCFQKSVIIIFWLSIWQLVAFLIHQPIFLVGPLETLQTLIELIVKRAFWLSIGQTSLKLMSGFILGFICGLCLATLAYRFKTFAIFITPLIQLMKTVPIASFIVLALVWTGTDYVSILISFIVVVPTLYLNILNGLKQTDEKLLEMAHLFKIKLKDKIHFIYFPALLPSLLTGCELAIGMCWKAGIAAEIIGVPKGTIGEHLYEAKVYLNTPELLAWTIVIVLLSQLFEKGILYLLRKKFKRENNRMMEEKTCSLK